MPAKGRFSADNPSACYSFAGAWAAPPCPAAWPVSPFPNMEMGHLPPKAGKLRCSGFHPESAPTPASQVQRVWSTLRVSHLLVRWFPISLRCRTCGMLPLAAQDRAQGASVLWLQNAAGLGKREGLPTQDGIREVCAGAGPSQNTAA